MNVDGTVKDTVIGSLVVTLLSTLLALALGVWVQEPFAQVGQLYGDGFEVVDAPGGELPDPCDSPLVMPSVLAGNVTSWQKLFTPRDGNPRPTYPDSNGFPVPIGADKGAYVSAEFVALPNQVTNLFWDPAQASPHEGYRTARPARGMFVGISECPGDLRYVVGCSRFSNTGSIIASTRGAPSMTACSLIPLKTYYITVAPLDPTDGVEAGEHSCADVSSSQDGCDVQARQTSY